MDAHDTPSGPGMRTVGLLGGMGWPSTIEYYRVMNETAQRRLGGGHSAPSLVYSFDFAEIEAFQQREDWDGAGRRLAGAAAELEAAGAGLLAIGTNTMHIVAPAVEAAVAVPLVHIADAVAAGVRAAGTGDTVGLLGTRFVMEGDFYRERLERHGLRVLAPGADDRALVDRIIFDELVGGRMTDASRQAYRQVIRRLVDAGAAGIILGCTEIELLVSESDSDVPVFPSTRLHAEALVERALEPDRRPATVPG